MSLLGWIFGIGAAVALFAVMLYSLRRGMSANRKLGPTQKYLQLHLWGGLAFFLLFYLHTGFGLPSGALPLMLWAFSVWVVLTGAIGLLLQRMIPRILEPTASMEVHLQRVPELIGQLRQRAEVAAAQAGPRVQSYYEQQMAPEMAEPRMVTAVFLRNPRTLRPSTGEFDILRRTLPPEGVTSLDSLRELRALKHEIDVHYTMQRILRGWLYFHLPVGVVLLGLVLLHVFFVLYF